MIPKYNQLYKTFHKHCNILSGNMLELQNRYYLLYFRDEDRSDYRRSPDLSRVKYLVIDEMFKIFCRIMLLCTLRLSLCLTAQECRNQQDFFFSNEKLPRKLLVKFYLYRELGREALIHGNVSGRAVTCAGEQISRV